MLTLVSQAGYGPGLQCYNYKCYVCVFASGLYQFLASTMESYMVKTYRMLLIQNLIANRTCSVILYYDGVLFMGLLNRIRWMKISTFNFISFKNWAFYS